MKRAAKLLKFAITSALACTLVILILRGRDPTFADFRTRSHEEAALDTVIGDVRIDNIPMDEAVQLLADKAHVRITFDENATSTSLFVNPAVVLYAQRITLGDALAELFRQENDELDFIPAKDGVRIVASASPANCWSVQTYDMRDTIARAPRPVMESKQEPGDYYIATSSRADLVWAATAQLGAAEVPTPFDRSSANIQAAIGYSGGRLFVLGSSSVQRRMRGFARAYCGADALFGHNDPGELKIAKFDHGRWIPLIRTSAEQAFHELVRGRQVTDRPLEEVIAALSDETHVEILVDWRNLEAEGADTVAPVSLDTSGMTLGTALHAAFDQNAGGAKIGIRAEGASIKIGPQGFDLCTRAYDLRSYFAKHDPREYDTLGTSVKTNIVQEVDPQSPADLVAGRSLEFIGPYLLVVDTWENQEAIGAHLSRLVEPSSTQPVQ